jgi:hypothetical protein
VLFGLIVSIILVTNTAAKISSLEDFFVYSWNPLWLKVASFAARTRALRNDAFRTEHLLTARYALFGIPYDIITYRALEI